MRYLFFVFFILFTVGSHDQLQARNIDEFWFALQNMKTTRTGSGDLEINDQLFGLNVYALLRDTDGTEGHYGDADQVYIRLESMSGNQYLDNTQTWEEWRVQFHNNYDKLLSMFLFSSTISECLTGQNTAIKHTHYMLSNVILPNLYNKEPTPDDKTIEGESITPRKQIGGLIEVEDINVYNLSGRTLQSIIYLDRYYLALQGRYTKMRDYYKSQSLSFWLNFYPHYTFLYYNMQFTIGFDGYLSSIKSWSQELYNIGDVNIGGGLWGSVRKDFSRLRLGVGASFVGSKSYLPAFIVSNSSSDFVKDYNRRKFQIHAVYGGIVGLLLAEKLSFNLKFFETILLRQQDDAFFNSQKTMLAGFSYLFDPCVPVDFGYKISYVNKNFYTTGFFLQGNFRW